MMNSDGKEVPSQAKKEYVAPKITIHGDVEKITEAIAGNVTDGVIGSQVK